MSKTNIDVNRYFVAILYKEDSNFKYYMENIKKYFKEVTYIEHNRDITEDGEIKKAHYHVLFKVGENARHKRAIAKKIGITENYLQGCNKTAMLRYLIHLDNPEKTQYKIEEVQGTLKNLLKEEKRKEIPEEVKYREIIRAIQEKKIKNITQLMLWAINNNCLGEIKKMQFILTKIIEEHKEEKKEVNTK